MTQEFKYASQLGTWQVENYVDGFNLWWAFVMLLVLVVECELPEAGVDASVGFEYRWLAGCDFCSVIIVNPCTCFGEHRRVA